MDRVLSLPVQEFIRACERIMNFASNHNGLAESDCHAVIFHATALIEDLGAHCAEGSPTRSVTKACGLAMDSDPDLKVLKICHLCRLVHDDRGTMDCWVSEKTYRLATGIDPATCRLTHIYCPACHAFLMSERRAA